MEHLWRVPRGPLEAKAAHPDLQVQGARGHQFPTGGKQSFRQKRTEEKSERGFVQQAQREPTFRSHRPLREPLQKRRQQRVLRPPQGEGSQRRLLGLHLHRQEKERRRYPFQGRQPGRELEPGRQNPERLGHLKEAAIPVP